MTIASANKTVRASRKPGKGRSPRAQEADVMATIRKVRKGFPYSRLANFQKYADLPWDKVSKLVQIPMRTLTRRQADGRLRPDESDRLLRVSDLFEKVVDFFYGDVAGARRWMRTPLPALDGETPLDMADTAVGVREVENLILRLQHGIFS